MRKIILTAFAIIATISVSFGQTEEATTKSGKKVVLNSDGTWKYQEEKNTQTTTAKDSDCSNYIETTEDKMTGKKSTAGKNTIGIRIPDNKYITNLEFISRILVEYYSDNLTNKITFEDGFYKSNTGRIYAWYKNVVENGLITEIIRN